ncbi:MAG: TIGR04372 family glycosyltransferase [Alphaproteobacteria bacterium]|nr:TIGR04372 family glycosyltransferase [Alphaproteobacteria bacterium]
MNRFVGLGEREDRPFRLCGLVTVESFGDYVNALVFLKTVANQFTWSDTTLLYQDNRDYKRPLLRTFGPARVIQFSATEPLPSLNLLTLFAPVELKQAFGPWFQKGLQSPDMVLTDSMMPPPLLCSFKPLSFLEFSPHDEETLTRQLCELGLDRDSWFCTIHYREAGYQYKSIKRNFRDTDPQVFRALRDHVIDKLGGQVVRLGHPGMTPFPPRAGYVDLSVLSNSSLLQAFAVSRSRYLLVSPSGAGALGHAFNTPTGKANVVDYWQVNDHDLLSTVMVEMKDGRTLTQAALVDAGLDKKAMMDGLSNGSIVRVVQNPPTRLIALADQLHRETCDVEGWRAPTAPLTARPNAISWPPRPVRRTRFLAENA